MKLSALLLTLYLVTGAFGRNLAGGFERVWFWYAYQIDLEVFGQGNNFIAAGCKGNGAHGSCTFNEFIKWINNSDSLPSITEDVSPDVATTAKALNDAGLTGDYDLAQIYKGGVAGVPTLFKKVAEVVDLSKQALNGDLSSISNLLGKVDEASLGVSDLRNADYRSHLVGFVGPKAQSSGFQIKTKVVSYYGETFTDIDIRGTIAAYPKIANINNSINSWTSAYRRTLSGKIHWNIIEKLKTARIVQKVGQKVGQNAGCP